MALFKLKPVETIDFQALVRPSSPNTYLAAPAGFSAADTDQEAPVFDKDMPTVAAAWDDVVKNFPRTTELDRSPDQVQRTYVQRTGIMGYPDIITVRFLADARGGTSLAMYSRSQYGYSDMGTNRRRVNQWLNSLVSALNNPS